MAETKKTVLIIAGPTAVGKTAVAIEIARQLGTEIISADSRQCYQEMNIGTARPAPDELSAVKHHFIAEYPVTKELTAADYERTVIELLEQLFRFHDTVVICGGTGLYIKALCDGLDEMPPVNREINDEVEALYNQHGIEWLQATIQAEDPSFHTSGEIHNPARLIRALVFIRSTGKSILLYRTNTKKERPFRTIIAGLELPREVLYDRINQRVELMIGGGLEAEARALYPLKELKNLQTVGYTEFFDFFDGRCTRGEAIDKIKQHTRNYAKRQMTWFKKNKEIHWFDASVTGVANDIIGLL